MIPPYKESLESVYKVRYWDSHTTFGKLILTLKYQLGLGERPSPTQNERRLCKYAVDLAKEKKGDGGLE